MTGEYRNPKPAPSQANDPTTQPSGVVAALRHALVDGGRVLLVLLVIAAIARTAHLVEFLASNPLASSLYSDAKLYHEWAIRIADGDRWGPPEPFHHPPLYPYFLALVYSIVGATPAAIAVLQTALGVVTLLAIYALARRIAPRAFALAATACAAFYYPMALFETRVLGESLTTTVAAFSLLHLTGCAGALTAGRLAMGGFLLGLACGLRPNQLLALGLIAPCVGVLARAGRPAAAKLLAVLAILLPAALAIAPFALRNLLHAGEFVLVCDTGGVNLYLSHHAAAGASFRVPDPAWGNVEDQPAVSRQLAVFETKDHDLTWSEVSSHLAKKAWTFALEHPGKELDLLARRARACLDDFEYEVLYSPAAERAISKASWAFPVTFLPFSAFLLAGLFAVVRCRDRRTDPATVALALFALAQIATVLLFFQYARFRVVSLVAVAPLAALGAAEVVARLRARKPGIETLIAIGSIVVALLPATREAHEQVANQHVTIAGAFRVRGDFVSARAALERAAALASDHPRLTLERAYLALATGDRSAAYAAFENGLTVHGDDPALLSEYARVLASDPDRAALEKARGVAERAIVAAPGFVAAHEALGHALIRASDWPALATAMRRAITLPAANATLFAMLGSALRMTGDSEGARQAIDEALRRDPTHKQAQLEKQQLESRRGS